MNIKRVKRCLRLTILANVSSFFASQVQAQNMQEAVMIALAQYPAILAAQSRIEAADSDIIRAQGAHWPQVSWMGTYSAYNSSSVQDTWIQSPTVSMNIWSGWRIQSDIERSRSLAEASRHQQRITRDDIALQSTEGYLNWAHQLELVKLAKENLLNHQKIFDEISQIVAIDTGRGLDRSQAVVRLDNAKVILQQREGDLSSAAQRLNRMLLGKMPASPVGIDFTPGVTPDSLQEALGYVNEMHPIIAQLRAQIYAAQASVKNARAQYSPNLNVTFGKQTYQGTGQGNYVTQLILSVPIFDGGTAYGATGVAQGNLSAIERGLQESELVLRERIASFWSDWNSAKGRQALGQSQTITAQSLLVGYRLQFQVGRRSSLDLLNVQSDLFTYQSNAQNANYESRLARARIMASIGKLATAYTGVSADSENSKLIQLQPQIEALSPKPFSNNIGVDLGN
jgi:adhesin transport system outer membrane protein